MVGRVCRLCRELDRVPEAFRYLDRESVELNHLLDLLRIVRSPTTSARDHLVRLPAGRQQRPLMLTGTGVWRWRRLRNFLGRQAVRDYQSSPQPQAEPSLPCPASGGGGNLRAPRASGKGPVAPQPQERRSRPLVAIKGGRTLSGAMLFDLEAWRRARGTLARSGWMLRWPRTLLRQTRLLQRMQPRLECRRGLVSLGTMVGLLRTGGSCPSLVHSTTS